MKHVSNRPSPHQISAFAHTVREGSVTGAAKVLGVSQSAVSQHLAKLEQKVGGALMWPAREGIELTALGRELFELADRFLSIEQLIAEKFSDLEQIKRGNLQIIANAPQPALKLIAAYTEAYPDVSIDFSLFDWTSATQMLRERKADIGIITAPRDSDEFVSIELCQPRYVLYVSDRHALADLARVSLAELADERFLLPEHGSLTRRVVQRALARHGLALNRVTTTATFPVMRDAILQGVGVGPFLERSVAEETGLRALPIDEMPETYSTCLVAHKDRIGLRLINSFVATSGTVSLRD